MLRIAGSPKADASPRGSAEVGAALRDAVESGRLDVPLPGCGETALRWSTLARYGRTNLSLGRLVEGHTDAVAILHEAGDKPEPGALYGVWASRASGKGAVLSDDGRSTVVTGTIPFCSGAGALDRALVVARPAGANGAGEDVLLDIPATGPRVRTIPSTWQATGMADSRTRDIVVDGIAVDHGARVGPPGFYTSRAGFRLGAIGVAAVWLGGAAGVVDGVLEHLADRDPDEHQLAHLAAMHVSIAAADSLLAATADAVDAAASTDAGIAVHTGACRCAVEHAACDVLARAPRVTGPGPLSRDAVFTHHLADLEVYVRQHHGERELAELGRGVLRARAGDRGR